MKSLLLVLFMLFPACGKKDDPQKTATGEHKETGKVAAKEDPVKKLDSYTVKGRVTALPDPAADPKEIEIHHEEIPAFKSVEGETSPMESMRMPFAIGGVSLDGIAVKDVVQFTFEVNWQERPTLRLTKLEKLPADTALELSGK